MCIQLGIVECIYMILYAYGCNKVIMGDDCMSDGYYERYMCIPI